MSLIYDNVMRVRERVDRAAVSAGRDPGSVTLVAASKQQTPEAIAQAIDAGIGVFGENRVQELIAKQSAYQGLPVHMIGHVQTNKAAQLIGRVSLVQSLGSTRLAAALNRAAERAGILQDVLIEINIAREESKSGIFPEELDGFLADFSQYTHLFARGLMTIAPKPDHIRANVKYFEDCNRLFIDKQYITCNNVILEVLSMGMSYDFETAIACGATMVRVGTAIFGRRS